MKLTDVMPDIRVERIEKIPPFKPFSVVITFNSPEEARYILKGTAHIKWAPLNAIDSKVREELTKQGYIHDNKEENPCREVLFKESILNRKK